MNYLLFWRSNVVFFYPASFFLLGPLGLSLSEIDKFMQADPINSVQQGGGVSKLSLLTASKILSFPKKRVLNLQSFHSLVHATDEPNHPFIYCLTSLRSSYKTNHSIIILTEDMVILILLLPQKGHANQAHRTKYSPNNRHWIFQVGRCSNPRSCYSEIIQSRSKNIQWL